jgi:hypothetical protein
MVLGVTRRGGMNWIKLAGFYEHGNEIFVSIKAIYEAPQCAMFSNLHLLNSS